MAVKDIVLKLVIDGKESLVTLDKIDNKTGNLTKSVRNVAGALGLAFGSAQVIGWIKESIALVQRENEVIGKLNATLESTQYVAGISSTELINLAKHLEEVNNFKFDDKDIIDAEGLLLTFKKINKEIFPEAIQLALDLSVRFEQDLTSSVKQVGKALEDPIRGMTALRKAGVQFDDTQEKLIRGFIKSNNLIEAQKIILAELSLQVSGSAKNSVDEFTASWAKVTDAIEDATISVGRFFQTIGIGVYEVGRFMGSFLKTGSFTGAWMDYNNKKADEQFNRYKDKIESTRKKENKMIAPPDFGDKEKIDKAKQEADDFYNHLIKLEKDYLKWEIERDKNNIIHNLASKGTWVTPIGGESGGGTRKEVSPKELFEEFDASGKIAISGLMGATDSFWQNFIMDGRVAKDGWDALWLSFKNSALQQLGDILSNELFASLVNSGGKESGGGSFLDDLFSAVTTVLPFLGSGGIATKPTPAIVGDVPEAIIPLDRFDFGVGSGSIERKLDQVITAFENKQFEIDMYKFRSVNKRLDDIENSLRII